MPEANRAVTSDDTCCRLCSNSEMRPLYSAKGYHIAVCRRCDFAQVVEQPAREYLHDLYTVLHDKHVKFRSVSSAQKENRNRVEMLKRVLPHGATVLDAGCATGDFLAEAKGAFSVYGIDISASAIEAACARLPDIADRLIASPLEDIGDEWPVFDAVCMWDVIEHLWDPVTVCQDLMSLVKPGGYLFLSTPDMGSMTAKVFKANWAFMIPPYHLGFFSRKAFEYIFTHIVMGHITMEKTKGKWTNIAFLFYKLNQISARIAPKYLLDVIAGSWIGRMNIYVPTNDIIYIAVQKPSCNQ